jgi:hypothetical protein
MNVNNMKLQLLELAEKYLNLYEFFIILYQIKIH